MTVTSVIRKAGPFAGNNAATTFPFSFKVFAKTDIKVLRANPAGVSTTLTLDSDYSVQLNGDQDSQPGGWVTYPRQGGDGLPLPSGYDLVVLGNLPYDQKTDLTNSGGFYPQSVEDMSDRSTIQIQQLAEVTSRAIVIPEVESTSPVLPNAQARANSVIGFDVLGNLETFPLTPAVGAGDLKNEIWISGTDYTEGVSTSVTLSRMYGTKANLGAVVMQGVAQDPDSYALNGDQLQFNTVIPVGVKKIWSSGGTTLSLEIPPDESITDAKLAPVSAAYVITQNAWTLKRFGAKGDGVRDDTAAIQNALDSGELDIRAGADTYAISEPVILRVNGVSLRGAGENQTTFKNLDPAADSIQIANGMTGCTVAQLQVLKTLGAPTTSGNGVLTLGTSADCLISRVRVSGHFCGFVLRGVDYGEIEDCAALKNWNVGFDIANSVGYAPTQWQMRRLIAQLNNSHGFFAHSQAGGGGTGMILGAWTDLQTFANNGAGLALVGSAGAPIDDLRLNGFFFGSDNGSEIYCESFGSNNRVSAGVCEYASIGTSGPTLSTANGNTSSSVHIGLNEQDFSISDSLISVTPDAGIDVYHGFVSINNVNIFDSAQNVALSGAGVRLNGGSTNITGGFNSRNKVGISFAAGVGAVVSGGNYAGNTSGATGGSTASSTITGCFPTSMNT